jgi:predicted metal-dependent hydrolase
MAHWKNADEFKGRVKHWADKLDIKVRWLALRPMRNKWASCSTNGNLNFNAELLGLNRDIGEYVIVHELLHLVVPHHGKLWKSLMRAHLGDYESLDEKLTSFTARARSSGERSRTSSKRATRKGGRLSSQRT